ncbi:MAG: DUF6266 family protein, partial [Chryseobacterium sp.]
SKSRVNMAVSYTISEAIQMTGDVPELMYNKVLITKGDLTGFQNMTAAPQTGNIIRLSWENNSTQGNASETDQVNVICYCEELDRFEIFESVAVRTDLTKDVILPAAYMGKEIQVWSYLHNGKGTAACNSVYVGAVILI